MELQDYCCWWYWDDSCLLWLHWLFCSCNIKFITEDWPALTVKGSVSKSVHSTLNQASCTVSKCQVWVGCILSYSWNKVSALSVIHLDVVWNDWTSAVRWLWEITDVNWNLCGIRGRVNLSWSWRLAGQWCKDNTENGWFRNTSLVIGLYKDSVSLTNIVQWQPCNLKLIQTWMQSDILIVSRVSFHKVSWVTIIDEYREALDWTATIINRLVPVDNNRATSGGNLVWFVWHVRNITSEDRCNFRSQAWCLQVEVVWF